MSSRPHQSIEFTEVFLESFASREFSAADRRQFLKALHHLDQDESHPSLRGDREGSWSASASGELHLTFERLPDGQCRMLTCSRHYDR